MFDTRSVIRCQFSPTKHYRTRKADTVMGSRLGTTRMYVCIYVYVQAESQS